MLVAQAALSSELFTGTPVSENKINSIERSICADMENIILIGMPGCGKTSVAKILGEKLEREVSDADDLIEKSSGSPIPDIFKNKGEAFFRKLESNVLLETGQRSGLVISTGGGCVTQKENYDHLHRNGKIVWIRRSLNKLPKEGRPISEKTDLSNLFEQRAALYEAFADITVWNDKTPEETADKIIEELKRKY